MRWKAMLRGTVAAAAVAASILLTGATATPSPTPTPPIPDDPTDPVRALEYWLDGAGIRDAWQTTRGEGVTIAVIDTGIGKVPSVFGAARRTDGSRSGPSTPTTVPGSHRSPRDAERRMAPG
jgi:subtilisin family serine protease